MLLSTFVIVLVTFRPKLTLWRLVPIFTVGGFDEMRLFSFMGSDCSF